MTFTHGKDTDPQWYEFWFVDSCDGLFMEIIIYSHFTAKDKSWVGSSQMGRRVIDDKIVWHDGDEDGMVRITPEVKSCIAKALQLKAFW